MSRRLMDAWNIPKDNRNVEEEEKKAVAPAEEAIEPVRNKGGRPASTIDRSKEIKKTAILMSMEDYIYCTLYAKELKKRGLSGSDVSSVISYMIKKNKEENPGLAKAAEGIYELQTAPVK